jgi:formylglycine-generating enzyme required for sulfatase activity
MDVSRGTCLFGLALMHLLLGTACRGNNLAAGLARAPEIDAQGQSRCGVMKSSERPLIIEWPSSDRGALEGLVKRGAGLVAVRYSGCEMEVVRRCAVPGSYDYTAVEPKRDDQLFQSADDLYAKIPIGAAQLEAELARHGELSLAMTVVGQHHAARERVGRDELSGDCEAATHVITMVHVGAFKLASGAGAKISAGGRLGFGPAAGASSSAERGFERSDGDPDRCASNDGDPAPPAGCSALLRLEVEPIREAAELAARRKGRPCPRGTVLVEGGRFRPTAHKGVATIDDFCLDLHEVTVAEYADCADDGHCSAAATTVQREGLSDKERAAESALCNGARRSRGKHPVNCVTWNQAEAYCRARGGHLPSEPQWEWAARGGSQERSYAWGEEEPGPRLVNACGRECARHFESAYSEAWPSLFTSKDGAVGTAKVGSHARGAGRDRVQDLAGNVWEWTSSAEITYASEVGLDAEALAGFVKGGPIPDQRVSRGGGFTTDMDEEIRVTARKLRNAKDRRADLGFRCARDP